MEDKRLVATKKDIIIFFVFAFSFTIIDIFVVGHIKNFKHFISLIKYFSLYFPIPVLAILINNIIKFKNIKNEKILKITKILFNIFAFIYFFFMAFLLFISFAVCSLFS